MARWTDDAEHDPGVALLELLAFAADLLARYQDQISNESRLRTRRFVIATLAAVAILCCWWRRKPLPPASDQP